MMRYGWKAFAGELFIRRYSIGGGLRASRNPWKARRSVPSVDALTDPHVRHSDINSIDANAAHPPWLG